MNKNHITKYARLLLFSLLVTMLAACGGEDTAAPNQPNSNRSVQGQVHNILTGDLLNDATVTISGHSTHTTSGRFILNNLPDTGNLVVKVSKNGFVTTSRRVTFTPGSMTATVEVLVLPVTTDQQINASSLNTDVTVNVPNSVASVLLPAGSLIDPDTGAAPTGNVTAHLTPINPAANVNAMPGDYTAIDTNGTEYIIESFGALSASFTDASGNELNLAPNTLATVRIPVSSRGNTTPQTIPLYYFDEDRGLWVQEGTATLDPTGSFYEGTVSHFTVWNADRLYESITITGCVENAAGNPVNHARVSMEGQDYNGSSHAFTNSQGIFTIQAKRGGISLLNGIFADKLSSTVTVGDDEDTNFDLDITSSCLILANEAITARLTWGENPADLDTHLYGPNDYHIWFSNLGSLNSAPFAQLDVDDTDSFGPEVLTIAQFPEPGTYRYAVHHYSGTSTISNSSAQIRLRLNGRTSIFTPPPGQSATDDLWNVFNLIVDANGNVTLEVVNTWSSLVQARRMSANIKDEIMHSSK